MPKGRSTPIAPSADCRRLPNADVTREYYYRLRTATEVSPRKTPLVSVNWTKTRLTPGESATVALPVTKMPKVGVALAAIVVVTVDAGVARQAPVVGLVWHSLRLTGKLADRCWRSR